MPEVFVYLFKINIAISLFYCGYYFFLRKLTFYSVNRFYLLFSVLISVIFPFLSFQPIFSEPEIISYDLLVVESTIENLPQIESTQSMFWPILNAVYWFIVFLGGLKLLVRLISLYRIHLKSSSKHWKGYKFNNLSLDTTPFSFLRNTYLNFNKHTEQELLTILKHESVHTKHFHSLDIVLMEIWTIFSWFNPVSWLLKKAVKENVEFIADQEVIRQGTSYQHYQKSLLDFATQTQHIPLTNQFSFISLKSRIIMMNKKKSSKKQLGMYFLIVPCIVASLFVFGISKAYQASEPVEVLLQEQLQENDTILNQDTVPNKKEYKRAQPLIRKVDTSTVLGNPLIRKVDTSTVLGNPLLRKIATSIELENLLIRKVTTSKELQNPLVIVDGIQQEKTFEQVMLDIPDKEIESVSVFKDEETAAYGEKGKSGVIIIITKKGKEGLSEVKRIILEGDTAGRKTVKGADKYNEYTNISTSNMDASLMPSKSIKGPFSISGIDASLMDEKSVRYSSSVTFSKGQPLAIIEGKGVDFEYFQQLSSDMIESFSILKDKEAIKKYGDKGENGVILITTKAGEKAESEERKSDGSMELWLNVDTTNKSQESTKVIIWK